MLYFVLDLEFNQYFDFSAGDARARQPGHPCPAEIIQAGAVIMDAGLRVRNRVMTYVRPQIYKRLHPHVQRITGIQQGTLSSAPSFAEVFEWFFAPAFEDGAVFCTWGTDDTRELHRNASYYGLDCGRLTKDCINVQKLFSVYREFRLGQPSHLQAGLKTAVETLGLRITKPFHDAQSDAEYTAKILRVLLRDALVAQKAEILKFNNNKPENGISPVNGKED